MEGKYVEVKTTSRRKGRGMGGNGSFSPPYSVFRFFQPVLSGSTASKVKGFEVITMSTYTLGQREKIFQILEAEAQQKPMMLPEGIKKENKNIKI